MTRLLQQLDTIVLLLLKPVIVLAGLSVAFMLAYAIFARAILESPVFGIEEIMLFSVMWFYMLGAVLATRERSHLKADFIKVVFRSEKVHQFAALISSVIALFISLIIFRWSLDLVGWGLEKGQKTPVFGMPQVWSQISLLVAAFFFVVYNFRDVVLEFRGFKVESSYFPSSDDN